MNFEDILAKYGYITVSMERSLDELEGICENYTALSHSAVQDIELLKKEINNIAASDNMFVDKITLNIYRPTDSHFFAGNNNISHVVTGPDETSLKFTLRQKKQKPILNDDNFELQGGL